MLNKIEVNQTSYSKGDSLQAGRDINISNHYNIDYNIMRFYEDDIKEIIIFFSNISSSIKETDFIDNSSIPIEEKNRINDLSEEYFELIKSKSLPNFNKIQSFLGDPRNEYFVELYQNTTEELQEKILAVRHKVDKFQEIFDLLKTYILESNRDDKNFIKHRNKIVLFLHFMYYNCDIGFKK